MKLIRVGRREFWVGSLKRRNSDLQGLVVYDPLSARQGAGCDFIRLFEVAENRVSDFRREIVCKLLGPVDQFSEDAINKAIESYCTVAGINLEAEQTGIEIQDSPRQDTLNDLEVGVHQRVVNCYKCGVLLANGYYQECVTCGWLVCDCGACGCQYQPGNKPCNVETIEDKLLRKYHYFGGEVSELAAIGCFDDVQRFRNRLFEFAKKCEDEDIPMPYQEQMRVWLYRLEERLGAIAKQGRDQFLSTYERPRDCDITGGRSGTCYDDPT